MILFYVAAVLCGLLEGQVVSADADDGSPSFYTLSSCKHPTEADEKHQMPLTDDAIVIALFSLTKEKEMEKEVDTWAPETQFGVTVTSPKKMELLVGVNAGTLERVGGEGNEGEGATDCDGTMWYTAARETAHTLIWNAPACCEISSNEVQLFVTGSMEDGDYLRQQHLLAKGEQGSCDCPDSDTSAPVKAVLDLPEAKAAVGEDTGTHFIDGEEPEDVISDGGGEVDPNLVGDDGGGNAVDSEKPSDKSSSFGYAFLIMLLTIAIALTSVWFYRKYRVRQMQYREFEGLEMRGYAQWADAAGL